MALRAALFAEWLKLRRSRVPWIALAALCLGPVMGSLFVVVLRSQALAASNPALAAKASLTGFSPDWVGFSALMAQVIGVGGVLVFGFVTSWLFGREFSDRTAKDLFALPVSRRSIVMAKLIAVMMCCVGLACGAVMVAFCLGLALGLENAPAALFGPLPFRIAGTTGLALLLCPPVAFVASWGRGYLPPLGFLVLAVVLSQILGALGVGAYFPWAVPGLFSGIAPGARESLGVAGYVILAGLSAASTAATIAFWQYADHTS